MSTAPSRVPPARIIAISDAVRRFLVTVGLPREKIVTLHYGLDEPAGGTSEVTARDLGIAPDAPVVLAIGRLTEQKDHPTLLRAFARAHTRHPRGGARDPRDRPARGRDPRSLIDELGLGDSVLLPGRLEIRDWLERADVFVHTSRWEGFGLVLLEAMLAGLPVVATRVSAVPEVVSDGGAGCSSRRATTPGSATRWPRCSVIPRAPGSRARGARARTRSVLRRPHGRAYDRRLRRGRDLRLATDADRYRSTASSPGAPRSRAGSSSASIWFKGHNNPRYAELLPRLHRLDRYLSVCSDDRLVRGVQYRAYRHTRRARLPARP